MPEGQELEPGAPRDPATLRVSDGERHAVAEVLREAAGEGRLDLEELDQRLEATYAARTYADLVPLTADLPVAHPAEAPARAPVRQVPSGGGPAYGSTVGVMSETRRTGVWVPGDHHTAVAVMGSSVVDLRQAVLRPGAETVITATAVMGSIEVVIDAHTEVVVSGIGVMGDFSESASKVARELGPSSPVVRVRGLALMGAVNVKRKGPPGASRWPRRRR